MKEITSLSQLDLNGTYNYAEYLSWKFEETVELIKGKILPMSAPSRKHQGVSWHLTLVIGNHFSKKDCRAFAAPFDVRLLDKRKTEKANKDIYSVVQPDICVICDTSKLDDRGCVGAPDLVVEILSPGNSVKEMRTKKQLYEENGIQEYWIFDPEHETVLQFSIEPSGRYGPPVIYVNEDSMNSTVFPDLKFDLSEVFKD